VNQFSSEQSRRELSAPIGNGGFETARFLQGAQIETHQRNRNGNQHHDKHKDRPRRS
jgi:hypothetical protein